MGKKQDKETFAKLLIAIGGIIGIVAGALGMGSFNLNAILWGLVTLLLGLAALMSAVKPGQPIPCNIVVELIIGIILIVLHLSLSLGLLAGILIIIGGIFLAID
ncbi:MAG: hypothetical protein ACTSR8_07455 [Promethearchaeota archaeon]